MDHIFFIIIAVQIVGEALPISSSGHLQLCMELFGEKLNLLPDHVDHLLHGPTLLMVLIFFWRVWYPLACRVGKALRVLVRTRVRYDLSWSQRQLLVCVARVTGMVVVADCVTAVMYGVIKGLGLGASMPLLLGFCVTAGLLLSSKMINGSRAPSFLGLQDDKGKAVILGLTQGLALLPGISRFGSTVVVAQWLGMRPQRAVQFSFLMFFPLMCAAFVFHGVPVLVHHSHLFTMPTVCALLASTLISYGAFACAYKLVCTRRLWWFGVYMLVPIGLAVWMMLH